MRPMIPLILVVAGILGPALPVRAQDHTNEPGRVIETAMGEVVIDAARRTARLDGRLLEEASGVVDAAWIEGLLMVAQSHGAVLVYEPAADGTDAPPTLVQTIEGLGKDARAIVVDEAFGRAMLLSAGTTEVFGIRVYPAKTREENGLTDRAYVDHARYMEYLRGEQGHAADARAMDVGPQVLGLATDREVLGLFHPDRSYRVVSRTPLPEGLARVESLAYTGTRWVLAGLDARAHAVVVSAPALTGPWTDLGAGAIDRALAEGGEPLAWLPGGLSVADGRVRLAVRGERGALVSWPASSESLDEASVAVRWLDER